MAAVSVSAIHADSPRRASWMYSLAGWLFVQLLALLIPVLHIPLSDSFVLPADRAALDVMLVVQIAFAAMLFPSLLLDLRTMLISAAATWPFLQLAGTLSAAEPLRIVLAGCYVCAWLALLWLYRWMLPCEKSRLMAVAIAAIVAIGLPVAWYFRAEFFTGRSDPIWDGDGLLGPVMGALAIVHQPRASLVPWLPISGAMLVALPLAILLFGRES